MIGPKQLGIADILLDLGQVLYSLNRLGETLISYAKALYFFRIHYGYKHLKIVKCLGMLVCLCNIKKRKFLNAFNTLKNPLMFITFALITKAQLHRKWRFSKEAWSRLFE